MDDKNFIGSAPFLMVEDIGRAVDYYCDVLGFTRPKIWEAAPLFAMPSRDGFIVMLHQADAGAKIHINMSQGADWDAYFWVRDVDSLFAEFKSKGAIIEQEPFVQPYEIKEFTVQDADGHILAFGQHWPQN